jgi:8-oxo-dGTP diphosphatase
MVAADSLVFALRYGALEVLLIERGHEPFKGRWALPGGFVNEDEPLEVAVRRELREETGLDGVPLEQFKAYGDPGRDPRGWNIGIVFWALIDPLQHDPKAGDDASRAQWFPVMALPPLAFDHDQIVAEAIERLRLHAAHPEARLISIPETFGIAESVALISALDSVHPAPSRKART